MNIDTDRPDVLPDCRSRAQRDAYQRAGVWWVPLYCGNCGAQHGSVPQDDVDFAFYLCQMCVDKHGIPAGMMALPDEVWWKKIEQEQLDTYGRILSDEELVTIVNADCSPLATLIKEVVKGE